MINTSTTQMKLLFGNGMWDQNFYILVFIEQN